MFHHLTHLWDTRYTILCKDKVILLELTNALLKASQCKTREEAQLLIQRADNISQKMSGTCYGFEYHNEEHLQRFKVTHH